MFVNLANNKINEDNLSFNDDKRKKKRKNKNVNFGGKIIKTESKWREISGYAIRCGWVRVLKQIKQNEVEPTERKNYKEIFTLE